MKIAYLELLVIGIIIGLMAAFVLSLIVKWELHHRLKQRTGVELCMFCTAFWLSVVFTIAYIYGVAQVAYWHTALLPIIGSIVGVHAKLPR